MGSLVFLVGNVNVSGTTQVSGSVSGLGSVGAKSLVVPGSRTGANVCNLTAFVGVGTNVKPDALVERKRRPSNVDIAKNLFCGMRTPTCLVQTRSRKMDSQIRLPSTVGAGARAAHGAAHLTDRCFEDKINLPTSCTALVARAQARAPGPAGARMTKNRADRGTAPDLAISRECVARRILLLGCRIAAGGPRLVQDV